MKAMNQEKEASPNILDCTVWVGKQLPQLPQITELEKLLQQGDVLHFSTQHQIQNVQADLPEGDAYSKTMRDRSPRAVTRIR